jgi:hypothetical protein
MPYRTALGSGGAALVLTLLASGASAAIHCVHPTGLGGCATTIQAAVDLAAPGDTVRIAKGVYYEGVTVGFGKDGLQIVGAGPKATLLDGSPYLDKGFAGADVTLVILSPFVKVRNLGFRNGRIGVQVVNEHVVLQGLEFRGTDNAVLVYFAAHTEVLSNAFYDGYSGVVVQATDLVARGNLFERMGTSFSFDRVARPDRPLIVSNRLEGVPGGLSTSSLIGAQLRNNRLRNSGGLGTDGPNPVVEGNVLLRGGGLSVFCGDINIEAGPGDDVPAECSAASTSNNRVEDASGIGLLVGALDAGMVVRGNVLLRTNGLVVNGPGQPDIPAPVLLERNHVEIAGHRRTPEFHSRMPCFDVFGVGATLARNTALGCADQGFLVRGQEVVLEENRVIGALGSGIMVDGLQVDGITANQNVQLRGNVALRNTAQGIAVRAGAMFTNVEGNVATGNRTDFCDDGTSTGVSANTFDTVGPCVIDR